MGAHGGRCPATEHRCLLTQVLVECCCLVPALKHAGPPWDLHVTSRIHHERHQHHVAHQAPQLPFGPDSACTLAGSQRGCGSCSSPRPRSPADRDLQRTEISSSRWRRGRRLPHHRRRGRGWIVNSWAVACCATRAP
jgi:Ni/Co efflux regulator RcnB